MRILVDINHPAHVHLFKNSIHKWKQDGHSVLVTARKKDVTLNLLDVEGIDYLTVSSKRKGIIGLGIELLLRVFGIFGAGRKFKADVITSVASPSAAIASKLLFCPHLAFDDTEAATLGRKLYLPFSQTVITPNGFRLDLGPKHQRVDSYHELAYLHPNYISFSKKEVSIKTLANKKYFLLRFVKFWASHDMNPIGFSDKEKKEITAILGKYGDVLISSEDQEKIVHIGTSNEYEAEQFHELMYHAQICLGEGGTTATEAALMGVPTILLSHISSGNWDELSGRYGLMEAFTNSNKAISKLKEWLDIGDLKASWAKKQKKLLEEKEDMSKIIYQEVLQASKKKN